MIMGPTFDITQEKGRVVVTIALPKLQVGSSLELSFPGTTKGQTLVLQDNTGTYDRLTVHLPAAARSGGTLKARFSKKRRELRVFFPIEPVSASARKGIISGSRVGILDSPATPVAPPEETLMPSAATATLSYQSPPDSLPFMPPRPSPPPASPSAASLCPPSFSWKIPPYQSSPLARPTNAHEQFFAAARQHLTPGNPPAFQLLSDVVMAWSMARESSATAAKIGTVVGTSSSTVAGAVLMADLFCRYFVKAPTARSAFETALREAVIRRVEVEPKDQNCDCAENDGLSTMKQNNYWTDPWCSVAAGAVPRAGSRLTHDVGDAEDAASLVLEHVINTGHLPEEDFSDEEVEGLCRGAYFDSSNSDSEKPQTTTTPATTRQSDSGSSNRNNFRQEGRQATLGSGEGDLDHAAARAAFGGLKNTCLRGTPLSTVFDGFLPSAIFETLRGAVFCHPKCCNERVSQIESTQQGTVGGSSDTEALGEGFVGTRGFIARFNSRAAAPTSEARPGSELALDKRDGGRSELLRHPDVACLVPYFDAVRNPECNAFVLNVLICAPAAKDGEGVVVGCQQSSPPPCNQENASVGWHRDATLGLVPWASQAGVRAQLAHQVNVLYLHVPSGMRGGGLKIRDHRRLPCRREQMESLGGASSDWNQECADMVINPAANRMVAFRGDAEHCVASFSLPPGQNRRGSPATWPQQSPAGSWRPSSLPLPPPELERCRVSVVLEQYKVPMGSLDYTTRFEIVNPSDYLRSY